MLENVSNWLTDFLGVSAPTLSKIASTLILIVGAVLLRKIVLKVILKHTDDPRSRYSWQKGITYAIVSLGFLFLFRIWFEGLRGLDTIIGLFSAGLAIALKELVESFFAWIFILTRRPFSVGDRVNIDTFSGDVIDIRVFQFTLMEIGNWVDADQSTGRVLHIPNGWLFHKTLANYSTGFEFIWNEVPVLLTFESNWKKAKEILSQIADDYDAQLSTDAEAKVRKASEKYMIFYKKFKPKVYTDVRDSGVLLTIRYLTLPKTRRSSAEHIWEAILDAFARHADIDFAYPTTRFYNNAIEGKEDLRINEDEGTRRSSMKRQTDHKESGSDDFSDEDRETFKNKMHEDGRSERADSSTRADK